MLPHVIFALQIAAAATTLPPLPMCLPVDGSIEARAGRIGLDFRGFKATGVGAMSGAWEGAVRIEVRRRGSHDGVTQMTVRLDAATASPLRMEGNVSATPLPEGGPIQRVQGRLEATTPDGEPPVGVHVMGTVDTRDRSIVVHYVGECGVLPARREGRAGA